MDGNFTCYFHLVPGLKHFLKTKKTKRQLDTDKVKEKLARSMQQTLHNLEVLPSRRQLSLCSALRQMQCLNQG